MSSNQQEISPKILDDLCSRFIINIPSEQRDDLVRILFAVELAHWFYIDFYCADDDNLHTCSIKDFAQQIFQHCPFLRDNISELDEILSRWREYKFSVPTYGAVLMDPTYEHILLVQGYHNRESWGFPKGKVQENESPLKCAIREVMEEVGFDMKDRAFEDQYLEREFNGQIVRLYIVKQVSLDTKFAAKTKNEIKEMRWFPIADLPCHRRDTTPHNKLKLNPKSFFMVIPFIKDLRRWIHQEREIFDNHQRIRHRTMTYHGNTHQTSASFLDSNHTSIQKHSTHNMSNINEKSPKILQKQISIQDTIQKHFSQILKNDSITVTDNTSITETLMKKENTNTSHLTELTPPMSNDDENQHPVSVKKASKSPSDSDKTRNHLDRNKTQEPLLNVTNDIFHFNGPRCWTQFRLNRSEVFRCLDE